MKENKTNSIGRIKFYIFILIFFLKIPFADAFKESEPKRIVLDETFSWVTKKGANETISRIKAAGFNVFMPCVWHGSGVTWRSSFKIKEPAWIDNEDAAKNWDPLAYLIKEAHRQGIEVHPWFTVAHRTTDILPEFYDKGTPEGAFDIHKPKFRKFILARIEEVVRDYDVDGINLDYIRSKGVCTSISCAKDYKQQTGMSILTDAEEYKKNEASYDSSPSIDASIYDKSDPVFERIANWNSRPLRELIAEAKNIALKKKIPLSVSTHTGMKILRGQGADAIQAANSGLIDFILHMDYEQKDKIRYDLIDNALSRLKSPSKFILMVGNYDVSMLKNISNRDAEKVSDLVRFSVDIKNGTDNVALYQSIYLTDEQILAIRKVVNEK
jgi:uncharacterized lipoprotein YddW (UPF0748 family)